MKKLLLCGMVFSSFIFNNVFSNSLYDEFNPHKNIEDAVNIAKQVSVLPFMEGPSIMPLPWFDSFFKIKLAVFGENVYLYQRQPYKDLVGRNYGSAYLSCHYGNSWAWAIDDFNAYSLVYGKWGQFYEKEDSFVFAVTMNNVDIHRMKRDCKKSLEARDITIANANQISFGVNHSVFLGTRLTQYELVYYTDADNNGIATLIQNR